jgi:hypothetical protein
MILRLFPQPDSPHSQIFRKAGQKKAELANAFLLFRYLSNVIHTFSIQHMMLHTTTLEYLLDLKCNPAYSDFTVSSIFQDIKPA